MIEPLSSKVHVVPAIVPSAGGAASTALYGTALDLETYRASRVLMIVTFGVITAGAVMTIKAQTDAAAAFSTPLDITGSSQVVADDKDDLTFMIDVINPPERFVRLAVMRATQTAVVSSAYYLVYGLRGPVVTQTVAGVEVHRDKATGTA
jgi:hypothetical protein